MARKQDATEHRDEGEQFDRFLEKWSRGDFLRRAGGAAAFAAFAAGTLPLAACSTGAAPVAPKPSVTPVKGGTVTEAGGNVLQDFNPVNRLNVAQLVNGPMALDTLYGPTPTPDFEPALAASLPTISPDDLTYTIPLRKNVMWSDGKQLTADDVLFTFNLMLDPQYSAVASNYRQDFRGKVASIQASDPYTVVFKLKSPDAPFLTRLLQIGIAPKHVLSPLSAAQIQASFTEAPKVVNGVFKVVEWKKGDYIKYARNETYYAGPSLLDGYVHKTIPDVNGLVNQLKTGEIDVVNINAPGLFDELRRIPNVEVVLVEALSVHGYAYNLDPAAPASKIFSSKAVRQALLYALDRQGIANAVYFKNAHLQDSTLHASSWAYNETKLRYPFDAKKAANLLEADGWKPGASGIREKNGVKLSFEASVPGGAAGGDLQEMFQVMTTNWKSVGADVQIRPMSSAAWVQSSRVDRKFDVIYMNLPTTGLDPDQSAGFHSRNAVPGALNVAGYKNSEVDRLLDQAASVTDRTKRKQLYQQIQDILLEEVPRPALMHAQVSWSYNKRVHVLPDNIGGNSLNARRPNMNKAFVTS